MCLHDGDFFAWQPTVKNISVRQNDHAEDISSCEKSSRTGFFPGLIKTAEHSTSPSWTPAPSCWQEQKVVASLSQKCVVNWFLFFLFFFFLDPIKYTLTDVWLLMSLKGARVCCSDSSSLVKMFVLSCVWGEERLFEIQCHYWGIIYVAF